MFYTNPILQLDFSDPDVIRVKDDFYLIASSFNHLPGLPILHSKNLVEWSYLGYAVNKLPKKFDSVCHGEGIWAPSIRYHDGTFYILIPMPDEGIFVTKSKSILGPWSDLEPIILGKGYEDPCPLWVDDKCYLVFGFVKSRIGFNSKLAVVEVSPDLSKTLEDYQIVYDGHNTNPTIEGPKFHYINGFYYILAPAGSVKSGWQTCLRSRSPYGPYEEKIVLTQSDTLVNGPHQGALVDLDDSGDKYMFVHFQDMRAYGRITHLEPCKFINDWPVMGDVKDSLLCGSPVSKGLYPVDIKTNYQIQISDDFKDSKLSYMWQAPCNLSDFYKINNGLIMKMKFENNPIHLIKEALYTKVSSLSFDIKTTIDLSHLENGDHIGFTMMGKNYSAIEFYKKSNLIYLCEKEGSFEKGDSLIIERLFNKEEVTIYLYGRNENIYNLDYYFKVLDYTSKHRLASAGRWVGAKIGYYAYKDNDETKGYARILNYITKVVK